MNWLEVTIETTSAGIDPVCAKIIALGIEGMQIEDMDDFREFLENNTQYWDYVDESLIEQKKAGTAVKVYLSDTPSGRDTLSALRAEIARLPALVPDIDLGTLDISLKTVQEGDWEHSWKQYYKPTPIGEKLLIVPEWEPVPETGRAVFINNPGMSFGTGTHASTRLALELLEKYIRPDDTLLDLGCGSGILAICGILMGAQSAVAVDIDPNAVEVAAENAARNSILPDKFRTYAGDVLTNEYLFNILTSGKYRMILANIVADVILKLPPLVTAALDNDNGVYIASGIIEPRLREVEEGLTGGGMKIIETMTSDGWSAIAAKL
jgi:ribosomal protein L11 methyltransferase